MPAEELSVEELLSTELLTTELLSIVLLSTELLSTELFTLISEMLLSLLSLVFWLGITQPQRTQVAAKEQSREIKLVFFIINLLILRYYNYNIKYGSGTTILIFF